MKISTRLLITLATGRWMVPDRDEFWEACNFVTQCDLSNLTLYSRGARWVGDEIARQFPEIAKIDCSSVNSNETAAALVRRIEDLVGEFVEIQPADHPFYKMSQEEEWYFLKGEVNPDSIIRI